MTSTCSACGSPVSRFPCSRCGYAPLSPGTVAPAPSSAGDSGGLGDATVARPLATLGASSSSTVPASPASAPTLPEPAPARTDALFPAPPPSTSESVRGVAAHVVLWVGLLLVLLVEWKLALDIVRDMPGPYWLRGAALGAIDVLPFAVAVVVAARSVAARITAAVGAVVVTAGSAFEAGRAVTAHGDDAGWGVTVAVAVLGLATWIVARGHARGGYVVLVPAALVVIGWCAPWSTGADARALLLSHGVTNGFLLELWSHLPLFLLAALGLISSLVRPRAAAERDELGWALVGPLAVITVLLLPLVPVISSSSESQRPDSSADYTPSGSGTTGSPIDPGQIAQQFLAAAREGSASAAGCDGRVRVPTIASYSIDDVSPDTSGAFDVSATVTLSDGSTYEVTVRVGSPSSGRACVESSDLDTIPSPGSGSSAAIDGFPVPALPHTGDPVPSPGSVPGGTTRGSVVSYTDVDTTPTTAAQLVASSPAGLSGDEDAAVQALIRFLTAINQQDFQAAWNASTYSTKGATYTSGFSSGYVTSRHYEVSFGQPQQLSPSLVAVPATFVSRQDPAAQGNPAGVTGCTFWPQYVFLAAQVNGVWLDDTAGLFADDPAVAPLKRADPSRNGKTSLNPLSQRVAC